MKRTITIAFLSVYTLVSVGVQMHLHYCCGKLADVHLFNDHACSHHDEEYDGAHSHCSASNDCCSFIDINLKVDDSHEQTAPILFNTAQIAEFESDHTEVIEAVSNSLPTPLSNSTNPPDLRRYLLFHALVLYA